MLATADRCETGVSVVGPSAGRVELQAELSVVIGIDPVLN